jgi:hypothetical protein
MVSPVPLVTDQSVSAQLWLQHIESVVVGGSNSWRQFVSSCSAGTVAIIKDSVPTILQTLPCQPSLNQNDVNYASNDLVLE